MKLNDAIWGALLLVFGGVLFVHVQGFPKIPGQQVGPSALPGALAVGLFVCGAILLFSGLRARWRAGGAARTGNSAAAPTPWVELPEWFGSAPQVRGFAVLVAVNLLYVFGVNRLGFVITGVIYLFALMWVLRVKPARALLFSVVMTLLIHTAFYKLLKVPLPWGVLQGIAW